VLAGLPIDQLPYLAGEVQFREWFERQLDPVAATILRHNPHGRRSRVHPGYRWGHGTKVLALYVRDIVLNSRFFGDAEVKLISPWLCCPIDSVVLDRIRELGVDPGVARIREIDSREKYWAIQDRLEAVAARIGVPRVWFDDVWALR